MYKNLTFVIDISSNFKIFELCREKVILLHHDNPISVLIGSIISPHLPMDWRDGTRVEITEGGHNQERRLPSYGSIIVESRQMKRWRPACPSRVVRFKRRDTRAIRHPSCFTSFCLLLSPLFYLILSVYSSLSLSLSFSFSPSLSRKIDSVRNYSPQIFSLSLSISVPLSLVWFYRLEKSTADSALNYRVAPCTRP